ncbi:hypothetical protein EJB05_51338, partial [Eragrostis curvula]
MATPKLALFLGALLAVLSLAAAQAPAPAAGNGSNCDPLNLAVCANVLDRLIRVSAGLGALIPGAGGGDGAQCCAVIGGLVDLNVAACLCTAVRVRANVLRLVRIDVAPLVLRLLLTRCGQTVPANFTCPPA